MKQETNERIIVNDPLKLVDAFINRIETKIGCAVMYQPMGSVVKNNYSPGKSDIDIVLLPIEGWFTMSNVSDIYRILDDMCKEGYNISKRGQKVCVLDPFIVHSRGTQDKIRAIWDSIPDCELASKYSKGGLVRLLSEEKHDEIQNS